LDKRRRALILVVAQTAVRGGDICEMPDVAHAVKL